MSVPPQPQAEPLFPPSCVVLDTNVVLDWLWFADPGTAALTAALEARQLRWLATEPMRLELALVLERPPFQLREGSGEQVLTSFDRLSSLCDAAPVAERLRCTDADDQKFIDLAVASGARWLFSRDRAVLKLARRAKAFGLTIIAPQRWPGLLTETAPGT
jgi:putative PIN family toxin of toxin-antitoxin system